ncbi:O-antigen translocase [Sphingomonas rosea]|uniref:O-antigen translocase n=1 Tax=Sphingomonas rosea TaxID=335605 RepID=A0ABP7UAC9_9SPHN
MSTSHRRILSAISLLGGSSAIGVGLSILRTKMVALVLGPAGIGLIGLMQSLVAAASALGGLGIANAAPRQAAAELAERGEDGLAEVRHGLVRATLLAALVAGVGLFLLRAPVARLIVGDPAVAPVVGAMGLAVALTIAGGSITAYLAGIGKVGSVALVNLASAVLTTIAAAVLVLTMGEDGIVPYLLSIPLGVLLAGLWVARPRGRKAPSAASQAGWTQARRLIALGTPLMVGTFVALGSHLALRTILQHRLGIEELGVFQAAFTLSTTYVGFMFQAIASDFYPRLSGVITDPERAGALIDEQTETTLLLAGPLIIGLIGFAPLVLHILYAERFAGGATTLQWQVLADILRIASWPLGYALLASARNRLYLGFEILAAAALAGSAFLLVSSMGIVAGGLAFVVSNGLYLVAVAVTQRAGGKLPWTTRTMALFFALLGLAGLVLALARVSAMAGYVAGLGIAALWGLGALRRLRGLLARKQAA